ncbi:MAG TPA: hypothetical protein VJ867_00625 [Gemmatimonadaceae bacterium]|nr:hypothetical protein [Gemmatimonadaceae bacterium]
MQCATSLLLMLTLATAATAQNVVQPEVRLDAVGPRVYSVQPGVGLNAALGYYARLSGVAGYAPDADARFLGDHWRADVIARMLLDPFREQRWALSVGGGVSIRRRSYLTMILDLEGPPLSGMLPAIQVGLGGGVRGAFVLRRAVAGRR